ncbi:MAG: histidine kinase [Clostridia bacterium]|nr:histidine kinase [Clostridia bacterium]
MKKYVFKNMRLRHKMFFAFLICVLTMAIICFSVALRFSRFETNMSVMLENQTLFGNYQNAAIRIDYLLNYTLDISDLPEEVGVHLREMMDCADKMLAAFPVRVIENLWYSTDSLCNMQLEIESLNTDEGFSLNAPQILRVLELIELQYSSVNSSIHNSILEQNKEIENIIAHNLTGYIAIILSGVLLCLVVTNRWSEKIVKPLDQLVLAARDISWERFDPSILPTAENNDEIGYLSCAFSDMADRIQAHMELIKEKAELVRRLQEERIQSLNAQNMLKKSELMILQSEINPHFLFNSMNLLRQMAYLERAPETGEITEVLSDMLRYSLGCMNKHTTLQDEIDNIRNYFFIQQKRFGGNVTCEIQADDPSILTARLPAMVLQPLVENSYKHSVHGSNHFIRVLTRRDQQRMCLMVEDNGSGFTPQRLNSVRDMLDEVDVFEDTATIGLKNVAARLKLFFQGDVEINIESVPYELTSITIDIPIKLS